MYSVLKHMAANLGLVLTMLFWGTQLPFVAVLLTHYDPFQLAALRFVVAAPVLILAYRLLNRGERPPTPPLWRCLLLGCGVAGFATLYTLGIRYSHPVTAAALIACSPLVAGFVAWLLHRVPPNRGLLMGGALAVLGGALASIDFSAAELGFRGGELLILMATVCWSWYSLTAQRWLVSYSQLGLTMYSNVSATLVLLLIYLLTLGSGLATPGIRPPSGLEILMFLSISLGSLCIGTVFWNRGVRQVGVVVASMYLNLIPVIAVLVAMGFGVRPRTEQLLGGALVLAGVSLAQWWRIRQPILTHSEPDA